MIIYSIVPTEIIFNNNAEKIPASMEVMYKGEKVQVTKTPNNEYAITRILSTSPKSYLNPELQPGTIIRL